MRVTTGVGAAGEIVLAFAPNPNGHVFIAMTTVPGSASAASVTMLAQASLVGGGPPERIQTLS